MCQETGCDMKAWLELHGLILFLSGIFESESLLLSSVQIFAFDEALWTTGFSTTVCHFIITRCSPTEAGSIIIVSLLTQLMDTGSGPLS